MGWIGWFRYDGVDIINSTRTETYTRALGIRFLRGTLGNAALPVMLDETYTTPADDDAPWYDPTIPASARFAGAYPVEVAGLSDSSRSSLPRPDVIIGGVPGVVRFDAKSPVFTVILAGQDSEAAEYGLSWLSRALLGAACSPRLTTIQPLGLDLEYAGSEPEIRVQGEGVESLLDRYYRRVERCAFNVGPTEIQRRDFGCDGYMIVVTFTANIGNPYVYGNPKPIMLANAPVDGLGITDSGIGLATYVSHTDTACAENIWQPLYDPECPALIAPPGPPALPLGCFEMPTTHIRRRLILPASLFPEWDEVCPTITAYQLGVSAPIGEAVRGSRIRFFPDPDLTGSADTFPCDFNGDVVFNYVPTAGNVTVNCSNGTVVATTSEGAIRRADTVVTASKDQPVEFAALSCGMQWLMTMDRLTGSTTALFHDVTLIPRSL